MRVLAVGAHPDDLEILCGGTLARYTKEGHDVVMCHATLPLFETERPYHPNVTPIYYMDTIMGVGFLPTEFVDVTETIETKVAMLEAHETQLTWLRDHDGVDIVEQMKTATRFRGQQCGAAYAEGFAPCLTWLRARTQRLLP